MVVDRIQSGCSGSVVRGIPSLVLARSGMVVWGLLLSLLMLAMHHRMTFGSLIVLQSFGLLWCCHTGGDSSLWFFFLVFICCFVFFSTTKIIFLSFLLSVMSGGLVGVASGCLCLPESPTLGAFVRRGSGDYALMLFPHFACLLALLLLSTESTMFTIDIGFPKAIYVVTCNLF